MNLAEILLKHKEERPEKIALVHKEREISFGELDIITNKLASGLMAKGIGKEKRIALICPNIPEFVISYFAVLKTGAVVIPVNFLFKGDELKHVLEHSEATSVIIAAPFLSTLLSIRKELPVLKNIITFGIEPPAPDIISYEKLIKEGSPEPVLHKSDKDDVAVILYTSGTTGKLKGAMLTHNNIYFDAKAANDVAKRGPSDCILIVIPLFHSYAMTGCMILGLICGAKLVLMEKFVPGDTLKAIEEHKVTIFMAVPAIYGALLLQSRSFSKDSSKSMELCVSGGAPMPEQLHKAFEERFETIIIEGDGPTECSPITSLNPVDGKRKVGSIGLPLPGVEMKIVDENNKEVPDETVGEIVVKGPNVMKGYLNDPEATEESIIDGWFHTGDLGKRDEEGYFYIVDRKKDLIITGGMNVYPREIEEILFKHPSVKEASVTSIPDYIRGEVPQAFVVLHEGEEIEEKELISYCKKNLAKFKVPKKVTFMDILPKSYTGKVLKRMLREKAVLEKCNY